MRRTTLTLATTALLLAPLTAAAKSRGFDSTIAAPVQTAVSIEVVLSEDLAHRADNLPSRLRDRRSGASSLRSGFANNGFYGEKSLQRLIDETEEELTDDLTKRGVIVSDDAPVTLRVVLEDVNNNRPTFEQLSREPSLSFESFGIGGAELSATLVSDDGTDFGSMSYRWFDSNIQDAVFMRGSGVWSDANRAISRFAKHVSKELSQS